MVRNKYADSITKMLPLIDKTRKEMAEMLFEEYSVFIDSFKNSPYAQFLDGA